MTLSIKAVTTICMIWPIVLAILKPVIGIFLTAAVLTALPAMFKNGWLQKALSNFFDKGPSFMRWILVGCLFCGLFAAARPLHDLLVSPFVPDKSQGVLTTKDEFDELKWMLTILAGFAVITSIAQVAAAWFSALTYDKQATAKLQEISASLDKYSNEATAKLDKIDLIAEGYNNKAQVRLDEIDKVLEDVKSKYPLFYEIEGKRNDAHDALIAALRKVFDVKDDAIDPTEAINYMKDFYHEIKEGTRLLVLSVESFASIDLHPPSRGSEVANLKLFAVFYHAKYRYEQVLMGTPSLGDLERARGYLLLALKKANRDFTLHNELGNVYTTLAESIAKGLPNGYPDFIGSAKRSFEDSLDLHPAQQRARYNLAYILATHEKQYDEAVKLLRLAKEKSKWQNAPAPPDLAAYLDYNLGCYLAQSVASKAISRELSKEEVEVKELLGFLAAGLQTGRILSQDISDDYSPGGDVWALYSKADDQLKAELMFIRPMSD